MVVPAITKVSSSSIWEVVMVPLKIPSILAPTRGFWGGGGVISPTTLLGFFNRQKPWGLDRNMWESFWQTNVMGRENKYGQMLICNDTKVATFAGAKVSFHGRMGFCEKRCWCWTYSFGLFTSYDFANETSPPSDTYDWHFVESVPKHPFDFFTVQRNDHLCSMAQGVVTLNVRAVIV